MRVDIWSDVVCPWCYVGKRRFEDALRRFEHAEDIEVTWRAFELDPGAPPVRTGDYRTHLARKYGVTEVQAQRMVDDMTAAGRQEGLDFHFERSRGGNTFDAHRLIHLAGAHGLQDAVKERLLLAYFTEGEPIGDREVLVRLVATAGIDPDEARDALTGDRFAREVREDETVAHELEITGVPFFVIDGRLGVPGAQPSDVMLRALDRAWSSRRVLDLVGADASSPGEGAPVCDGDSCPT